MDKFEEWFYENCDGSDLAKDACLKLWNNFHDQINIICRKSYEEQQAKINDLKNLLEKDEHAHNLYYENANLQTLVEEKDKRIEEVLFVIARAKDGYYGYSNDGGDTDNLVSDLEKVLGDNNANS